VQPNQIRRFKFHGSNSRDKAARLIPHTALIFFGVLQFTVEIYGNRCHAETVTLKDGFVSSLIISSIQSSILETTGATMHCPINLNIDCLPCFTVCLLDEASKAWHVRVGATSMLLDEHLWWVTPPCSGLRRFCQTRLAYLLLLS